MSDTHAVTDAGLKRLDWECGHFGIFAAELLDSLLDDEALILALSLAREQGVQLLVWAAQAERDVPPPILARFGGILVDRKATFKKLLQGSAAKESPPKATDPTVIDYPSTTASDGLVALAIISGVYSRFRIDPQIPRERFEAMYRLWIERSVRGELADAVLIVPERDDRDRGGSRPLGMISLSESHGVASIGLVAVAPESQGRGIGSALMRAAHRWMQERCAVEATVVTQLANLSACRLYERAGYQFSRVQPYYHFWL